MNRRVLAVVCVVGACVMSLGVTGTQRDRGDAREIEILTKIVELRRASVEETRTRHEAGLVGPREHAEVQSKWYEAQACLADEQGNEPAEREALTQQLALLREIARRIAHTPDSFSTDDRVEAEIAALRCELRIARIGDD